MALMAAALTAAQIGVWQWLIAETPDIETVETLEELSAKVDSLRREAAL